MADPVNERRLAIAVAAAGGVNLAVALFFLPHSPGFDERTLYAAIYAYQHYDRLFYPIYDQPLMLVHPPTKYWIVGMLVSSGLPMRIATAVPLVAGYGAAVAGIFACRATFLQRVALLAALSLAVTLCPFIGYRPENLTHGEIIGRIRPEDLVLVFWFGALVWLEASRRSSWHPVYAAAGAASAAFAAVCHYPGIPALAAVAVYGAAAFFSRDGGRWRVLAALALGAGVVLIPFVVAVAPYWRQIAGLLLSQGGERSSTALASTWAKHAADLWFLRAWMLRHIGSVWPAAALVEGPARLGLPLLAVAAPLLLAFRSSRLMALAALPLPLAVLLAAHKWIGYELPEIALFFAACGWLAAAVLEPAGRRARLAAGVVVVLALATASPLVADRSAIVFMDESHSPERLRALGRAVIGPGAALSGGFYTGGEDRWVRESGPDDPRIDVVAEREFHLDAAALHDLYLARRLRVAGFVFDPEMPSASTVYFTAQTGRAADWEGFVNTRGRVRRFSRDESGWRFKMLDCRAAPSELPWVSPVPPALIAGYIPRTDYCVNGALASRGLDGRYAAAFFRRTLPDGTIEPRALVPLVIDREADASTGTVLAGRCGCATVESVDGGMTEANADALVAGLRRAGRVVQFYATADDLAAGRSMAARFAGTGQPRD